MLECPGLIGEAEDDEGAVESSEGCHERDLSGGRGQGLGRCDFRRRREH